jgi:hypothetical protein
MGSPEITGARMLLCARRVRVLEARFHPATRSGGGFVVVGRVTFVDQNRASIEHVEVPRAAVRPFDSERLHEKLEFLVSSMVGDRARALLALQSAFWSFVDTQDVGAGPRAA